MSGIKLPKGVTAIPAQCEKCGKHKPLYIILKKYKTEDDSDDYHEGRAEIEVGYDNYYYCRRCIEKMTFEP